MWSCPMCLLVWGPRMEDRLLSRTWQGKVSEKPNGSPYSFLLLAGWRVGGWRNLPLVLTFHWPRLASGRGFLPLGSPTQQRKELVKDWESEQDPAFRADNLTACVGGPRVPRSLWNPV